MMKQLTQDLTTGTTRLVDLPVPAPQAGHVLIESHVSLISAGTEKMLVDFGQAGWLEKASQQPDKVREVIQRVRTDGLIQTMEAVKSKLDQPIPLGYANVGIVRSVGHGVHGFEIGDRVVSNGPHAEFVSVPRNLCARVPDRVDPDAAAFTVLGAIGLQGIRLASPTLGECVVVTGLGLIGLLTVQLLRAHGCRVLGLDFDESKCALARRFGAEAMNLSEQPDPLPLAHEFSRGRGVDAVLITAATSSSEPVSQAAKMCRKRGRIVLVGVTGLDLNRSDFYEKELTFQVSCSYGPGRYDKEYEDKGNDYPIGFVRWTEQRNLEAVLDMMSDGRLEVSPLVSHRFRFDRVADAYTLLSDATESYLGILLEYDVTSRVRASCRTIQIETVAEEAKSETESPQLGFIGAGNYAGRVLIPGFKAAGARLAWLANSGGVNGAHYARKFGFGALTTDAVAGIQSDDTRAVVVATRHDSHAEYVIHALRAGKDVFCEKPLALSNSELDRIHDAWELASEGRDRPLVMVGFNRRFAPLASKMRELLSQRAQPKALVMTVNAGHVPASHWIHDPLVGGGRIVGEACHFVDLLRFMVGSRIVAWDKTLLNEMTRDSAVLNLEFEDGSIGLVQYLANGSKAFPKERLEVFCGGGVLQLDNFRRLRGFGWSGFTSQRLWRQDKGQSACAAAFVRAVRDRTRSPIPFDEVMEVSRVSIALAKVDE